MSDKDMLSQERFSKRTSDAERGKKLWPYLPSHQEWREGELYGDSYMAGHGPNRESIGFDLAPRKADEDAPSAVQAIVGAVPPKPKTMNEVFGTRIDQAVYSKHEGGRRLDAYVPKDSSGEAIETSGATIATGVDFGTFGETDAKRIGLDKYKDLYEKVKPLWGLKGTEAQKYIDEHKTTITADEAETLDNLVSADLLKKVITDYDNDPANVDRVKFKDLPEPLQSVIYSAAHQLGRNISRDAPRFWNAVATQNVIKAHDELMDFGGNTASRRKEEGQYLFDNLLKGI